MQLKTYIEEHRRITYERAAKEIGYTKQHIQSVASRRENPSLECLQRIFLWSGGEVGLLDFLGKPKNKIKRDKIHNRKPRQPLFHNYSNEPDEPEKSDEAAGTV